MLIGAFWDDFPKFIVSRQPRALARAMDMVSGMHGVKRFPTTAPRRAMWQAFST